MNRDFREMLSALLGAQVEFLLVGAYAMAAHGTPRATGDLDIWLRADPLNADRVLEALETFGTPLEGLTNADLSTPGMVVQIGFAPVRVDLLTHIDGVTFDEAWHTRTTAQINDLAVPVIGRAQLIQNKQVAGRPQDLADVVLLTSESE